MTEILYYVLVFNGRYILNDFHNDTVTVLILMNSNFRVKIVLKIKCHLVDHLAITTFLVLPF